MTSPRPDDPAAEGYYDELRFTPSHSEWELIWRYEIWWRAVCRYQRGDLGRSPVQAARAATALLVNGHFTRAEEKSPNGRLQLQRFRVSHPWLKPQTLGNNPGGNYER